ncbi:MAG: hypothetical protein KF799_11930 [Bdellovibrionales bacterium]|nr:hypothetical protein [Bdellovibrionales bacterium]
MKSFILLSLISIFSAQAFAATTLEKAFAGVTEKSPACFARAYDKRHLAAHPKQSVRQIKVKLKVMSFEGIPRPLPIIALQVLRKGENRTWTNNINCQDYGQGVICGVECDGGSVSVLKRDRATLVLKNNGVLLYGGCGAQDADTIFLEGKKGGDDLFALPQVSPEICADISDERH